MKRSNCATAVDCEPPGMRLPEISTIRCRFSLSMAEGPELWRVRTTSLSPTEPVEEPTASFSSPSTEPRKRPSAWTTTSYWSSPALKVPTVWPATSVLSACWTPCTETPRSAARARSISRRTSGLPERTELSMSPSPGTVRALATSRSEYCDNLAMSGPCR